MTDQIHPLFARGIPDELGEAARAVAADPTLIHIWDRLAEHADTMARQGWNRSDAVAALTGAVLLPIRFGHADGSFNRRIRARIDMKRRAEAARLALRLADMLDQIEREPLPPDEVVSVAAIVPMSDRVMERMPSYALNSRPAEALRRLAAGLDRPPDLAGAPGLASQKPSWRDALREIAANLGDRGFTLQECDAVRLVAAIARATGQRPPTRDDVRDALRWQPGNRCARRRVISEGF